MPNAPKTKHRTIRVEDEIEATWTMGSFTYWVNIVEHQGEWAVIDLVDVAGYPHGSADTAQERVGERVTVPVAAVDVTRTTS